MSILFPTNRKSWSGTWLFSLALAWLVAADAAACEQVRAALDIGSGTTKMVVARVDHCENRILEVLAPAPGANLERQVEYGKHAVEASDGKRVFTDEVVAQGLAAILELKAVAVTHGAEAFSAVATAAFRSVDPVHARTVLERIRRETGIQPVVVEQAQEARIGFLAAAVKAGVPRERLVVWDIGGGSMQISYWDPDADSVAGYLGGFASDAMHRFLIEEVQGKDYRARSPNPILRPGSAADRPNDLLRAIRQAESAAARGVSSQLRQRLRASRNGVVGIGGVHFFSNCEFMLRFSADGCAFTRQELLVQGYSHAHLTDAEIVDGGFSATLEFAPRSVAGAALTVGFMNALGIDTVRAVQVDMAYGILTDPNFWESR